MGDLIPEAQVKGSLGWSFIALICKRNSLTFSDTSLEITINYQYERERSKI